MNSETTSVSTSQHRMDGREYLRSLPQEQQELLKNIIYTTIDMCSEIMGEPIIFPEAVAYKVFVWETLSHVLKNEYFDFESKTWKKYNEKPGPDLAKLKEMLDKSLASEKPRKV